MPELERPACLLCGAREADRSFVAEFAPYALARCKDCGFYYLSPRLAASEMAERYSAADYYASEDATGYGAYDSQAATLGRTYRALVRQLRARGLTGGRLLEVGAGYGYFLAQAREAFERIDATELAPDAVQRAALHADEVWTGGIEAVPEERRYDLVIALQVVEHVYEPHAFVERAVQLVRPGGHLLLAAPNMASPLRHLLGARWPSFKVPEHVSYFDAASLGRLMSTHGVQAPERLPYPHAFPASLIASKAGLKLPRRLGELPIWVPTTTVALLARRP
jgi:SAM-dependent methyltransferase